MSGRKLTSWLDGFLSYTNNLGAPSIFCLWAGLSTLAGAVERKIWVRTGKGVLYPNLYTFLVGPPGVGKTLATSVSYELLSTLEDHHIASTNVSRASLIDDLHDASRRLIHPTKAPSIVSFNSLSIISDELGVLLPSFENDFMNALTALYDGRPYSERKRTKDLQFKIDNPQLNMIAATTPSYLNHLLPEGAWDQGFLSRTLLIYSGEVILGDLWAEPDFVGDTFKALEADLKKIGEVYGELRFEEEAAMAINEWQKAGGPPRPDHPKLLHYTTRRTAHLLKLCMLASISDSDELIVTLDHYRRALDWLLEAEAFMPDIFKSMTSGGDGRVIDETWYYVYTVWMKTKKPIAEAQIINFIAERAPAHNVARILEVMKAAKILEEKVEPKIGRCYQPKARRV